MNENSETVASEAYKLMTVAEVADILQCSERAVAAWRASGELGSVKMGRLRRYRPEDVEEFIRVRMQGRPEEIENNSRNTT